MDEKTLHKHIIDGTNNTQKFGELWKYPDSAIAVRKDFDIFGHLQGRAIFIEAKMTKYAKEEFPLGNMVLAKGKFEPHQRSTINDIAAKKALVYAAVGLYQMVYPYKKQCFMVPAALLKNKETWTLQELQSNDLIFEMVWVPSVGWNWPKHYDFENTRRLP